MSKDERGYALEGLNRESHVVLDGPSRLAPAAVAMALVWPPRVEEVVRTLGSLAATLRSPP